MNKTIIIFLVIFALSGLSFAAEHTSQNFNLSAPKVVVTGGESASSSYSIEDTNIGDAAGGKSQSAGYSFDSASPYNDTFAPASPTVDTVTSPTNQATQTLNGTKGEHTSIYINGVLAVPLDIQTAWFHDVSLSEGENTISVTARDAYQLESNATAVYIVLDTTPPSVSSVTDDGDYTDSLTELNASWFAEDAETGIEEYRYAIGTSQLSDDVVTWTSAGTSSEITHTGLTLTENNTYYFSVKAMNGAGGWGGVGSSNGITVSLTSPTIVNFEPANLKNGYIDDTIDITISAEDTDGDELEYRFSLNDEVIQTWSGESACSIQTAGKPAGVYTIKNEVRDNEDGEDQDTRSVYLLRKPISGPSQ